MKTNHKSVGDHPINYFFQPMGIACYGGRGDTAVFPQGQKFGLFFLCLSGIVSG